MILSKPPHIFGPLSGLQLWKEQGVLGVWLNGALAKRSREGVLLPPASQGKWRKGYGKYAYLTIEVMDQSSGC